MEPMPGRPCRIGTGCRWLVGAVALALVTLPFCLWLFVLNPIWTVFLETTGPVYCAAFSPDGSRILAAHDKDVSLRLWDIETGREVRRLGSGCARGVHSLAFSPDGRRAVSTTNTSTDDDLVLWDVETGHE